MNTRAIKGQPIIVFFSLLSSLFVSNLLAEKAPSQATPNQLLKEGVVVDFVLPNCEGQKAGIRPNDILLSWSRATEQGAIESPFDLVYIMIEQASRGTVEVEGLRNSKKQSWRLGSSYWCVLGHPNFQGRLLSLYLDARKLARDGKLAQAIEQWHAAAELPLLESQFEQLNPWTLSDLAEASSNHSWDGYDDAYRDAIEKAGAAGPAVRAQLFKQWAGAFADRGDLVASASRYEKAIAEYSKLGSRTMAVSTTLKELGAIAFLQGDLDKAGKCFQQSFDIAAELAPDSIQVVWDLISFGVLSQTRGDFASAGNSYRKALAVEEKRFPGSPEMSLTLNDLGNTAYRLGDLAKAENYHRRALSVAEKLGPRSQYLADILTSLARCVLNRGHPGLAEAYEKRALATKQKVSPGGLGVAASLRNLGEIARVRGDLPRAQEYYERALAIAQTVAPRAIETQHGIVGLGYVTRDQGDLSQAESYFRKALLIIEKSTVPSLDHAEALAGLASTLYRQKKFDIAEHAYQQALAELEDETNRLGGAEEDVVRYRAKLQDFYKEYLALLLDQGKVELAFKASEASRARALAEMLRSAHFDIRIGVDPKLSDLEQNLHSQIRVKSERRLHLLAEQKDAEASETEHELQSLIARHQEIEGEIRSSSPEYMALTQPQSLDAKDVQRLLDPDTVLLEFSLGAERSYVWSLSQGALKVYALPESAQIERVARQLYRNLTARTHPIQTDPRLEAANRAKMNAISQTLALELSRMLLAPVANDIQGKRLLIVSDGALHYVPFAALPSPGKTAVPLIVEHEIVNLPSASVVAAIRQANQERPVPHKEVAVLADPVFGTGDDRVQGVTKAGSRGRIRGMSRSGQRVSRSALDIGLIRNGEFHLDRLIYTRDEAKAIVAATPKGEAFLALDFQANRATAIDPKLADYRIVHFATHGFLDSKRPELSGLVLSLVNRQGKPQDGFLGLEEIYNLKLPVDLVVLSGCQTGLGEEISGEGLIGLTRGFMYAGANRVMASLWSVDDFVTSELMAKFYRAMEVEKLRPAAALRKAQIEIWKHAGWRSPYYWAAFQIQGEWR